MITNIKLYATTCKGVKCANKKPKTWNYFNQKMEKNIFRNKL